MSNFKVLFYMIMCYLMAYNHSIGNKMNFWILQGIILVCLFFDIVVQPIVFRKKMDRQAYITAKKICKIYTILEFDEKCAFLDPALKKYLLRMLNESFLYYAHLQTKDNYSINSLWKHLRDECRTEVKNGEY